MARLTERQVVDTWQAINEYFNFRDDDGSYFYTTPKYTMNWDGLGPAIIWEDGPHEWAMRLGGEVDEELQAEAREFGVTFKPKAPLELPPGVYAEPYYSFALCLYAI